MTPPSNDDKTLKDTDKTSKSNEKTVKPKITPPPPKIPSVRKIPSGFESATIINAEYVIEGAGERISQTRLPVTIEPEKPSQKKSLRVRSDQPTVMMEGSTDFLKNEKTQNGSAKLAPSVKKPAATPKSSIETKSVSAVAKKPKPAGKNGGPAEHKSTVGDTRRDKVRKQLDQMQTQQTAISGKTQVPGKERLSKKKENTSTQKPSRSVTGSEDPPEQQERSHGSEGKDISVGSKIGQSEATNQKSASTVNRPSSTTVATPGKSRSKQSGCCTVM